MNAPICQPLRAPAKHRFTLPDVLRMWERGDFPGYPDIELIDGDIYHEADDTVRERDWYAAVSIALCRKLLHSDVRVVPHKTLDLAPHFAPRPDFYIHDRPSSGDVTGANVLLVIEVSDTTIDWDRDVKVPAYEKGGVREHWRIECEARRVVVYRLREDGTYGEPTIAGFAETATAQHVPGLALRLADLHLPD